MTRRKVTLGYISKDNERKITFRKRIQGIQNKLREITVLCGIQACAIIYSKSCTEPVVWPSPLGVQAVLNRFNNLPDFEKKKLMENQKSFNSRRIKKLEEKLGRLQKEKKRREMESFVHECLDRMVNRKEHVDLRNVGPEFRSVINEMIRDLDSKINGQGASTSHDQTHQVVDPPSTLVAQGNDNNEDYWLLNRVSSPPGDGWGNVPDWDFFNCSD